VGEVRFEVKNAVATITLDNTAKRNAVDATMSPQLDEAYRKVESDDRIRVAIITGEGDLAFCSGGDIASYLDGNVVGAGGTGQRTPLPKPWKIWKPFIAAIRGACVGGGFGLALACDLRVAALDARIGPSGLRRGAIPGGQQTQRLIRLVSMSKALEILLLSEYLTGEAAADIGLVQRAVPGAQVMAVAREWAERIASFSPGAVQATKRLAYLGLDRTWDESFEWEEQLTVESFKTDDAREGFASFNEHRHTDGQGAPASVEAGVRDAIDGLRAAFQADGADLEVVSVEGDRATVELVLGPDACLDCIVSTPVLTGIVSSAIEKASVGITKVDLVDPRVSASGTTGP
jgi:enoyl-CoA hydratase/carnithine racemase